MPYSIDITGVSGGTAPIAFYACDEYGNNCTLLGYAPGIYVLPTLLQTATTFMVKSVDSTGCIYFKIITCDSEESYFILTELGDFLTTEGGDILEFF
jgi:hypothetical protein